MVRAFGVQGARCKVQGGGCGVQGAGYRVQGALWCASRGGMARSARRCLPAAEEWFVVGTAVRGGLCLPDERKPQ